MTRVFVAGSAAHRQAEAREGKGELFWNAATEDRYRQG